MRNWVKKFLICLLKAYKYLISPLLGNHCRFSPTCSQYMMDAIEEYGVSKGICLGTKRLMRCHPCGGLFKRESEQQYGIEYDPVEKNQSHTKT